MARYRYRTRALIGPWRRSRDEAVLDAVGAKQALLEQRDPLRVRWVVPGDIEEEQEEKPAEGDRSARRA